MEKEVEMERALEILRKLRDRGLSLILFRNSALDSSGVGEVIVIGVEATDNLLSLKTAPDGEWGTGWKYTHERAVSRDRITDEILEELAKEVVSAGGWVDNHVWQLPEQAPDIKMRP